MNNIEQLKKKILFRSEHRGMKEMDLILSKFVKKYLNNFNINELKYLEKLLNIDDDSLLKWYLNKDLKKKIPINNVSNLLKNFKFKQ